MEAGYLGELRRQWRPLLAAFIGLGFGFSTTSYVVSIMAPHFIRDFGWSRADFALIGSLGLISVPFLPFVGRLTDRLGVRRTAAIGTATAPIVYLLLSRMTGDMRIYIALYLIQGIFCLTTTTTVYARTVVRHVVRARGLALAIVASAPAVFGAAVAPLVNTYVETHGWRSGYLMLAVLAAVAGATALLLLPSERRSMEPPAARPSTAKRDYGAILRKPAFWVLAGAMVFCNLPQVVGLTQLNLILLDNKVGPLQVSALISAFASGTLLGRFVCGLALDRFAPHWVATIGMMLSAFGLFLFASPLDRIEVVGLAVVLVGLSFGAEGDLLSFLVVRNFGVGVFSSVMGLMTAIISATASIGAVVLALTLKRFGGYAPFLTISGVSVLIGSGLFLLLPRFPPLAADPLVTPDA